MKEGTYYYGYDGGISFEEVKAPAYQKELKKLQKHYGFKAVLHSYEEAAWNKADAWRRLEPGNETWRRINAVKSVIAADFAMMIHPLIAGGKCAEEIIRLLGNFEDYLEKRFEPNELEDIWRGAAIFRALENEKDWWKK